MSEYPETVIDAAAAAFTATSPREGTIARMAAALDAAFSVCDEQGVPVLLARYLEQVGGQSRRGGLVPKAAMVTTDRPVFVVSREGTT